MAGSESQSDEFIISTDPHGVDTMPGVEPPADEDSEAPVRDQPPRLAGYVITGRLGAGGMGTVYRARQLSTNRFVALKVMRADVTRSIRSRTLFTQEVRLAARLQHPNVIRIYDSGIDCGQYYYAMELVEGETLDQYALRPHYDSAGTVTYVPFLSRREMLQLMRQICQGVHHAHLRGVIHRDIKPRNIVVSPDGQPHVLDFGLATVVLQERINEAAASAGLTSVPPQSEPKSDAQITKDFAGTPAFMSPEQSRGRPDELDIRTDVYSLGVTLYLLLTGQMPRDVTGRHDTVMRRVALEPVITPRSADAGIDTELQALVLKALAFDRELRYSSAGALADDLGRYIDGRPLLALRQTPIYVSRKWIGRHSRPIAIAFGVLLILCGLGGYSFISRSALRNTQLERADYNQTLDQLLARLSPQVSGRQISNRDLLNGSADDAGRIFHDRPAKLAGILDRIGMTLADQGWCRDARSRLQQALALQVQTSGDENLDSIRMTNDLAQVNREVGKFSDSASLSRRALTLAGNVPGSADQVLRAKIELAYALDDQGQFDPAAAEISDAISLAARLHPANPAHPDTLRARNTLAFVLRDQGKLSEAKEIASDVLKIRTSALGEAHPDTIRTMDVYATILCLAGNTAEARLWIDKAVELSGKSLGVEHTDRLGFLNDQGSILGECGDFSSAVSVLRKTEESSLMLLGEEDRTSICLISNLAHYLHRWADQPGTLPLQRLQFRQEAQRLLNWAIQLRNQPPGTDDPGLVREKEELAAIESDQNELPEAQKLLEYVLQIDQQRYGENAQDLGQPLTNLARVLQYQEKWADAEPLFNRAWKLLDNAKSPEARDALKNLNAARQHLKMPTEPSGE